MTQTVPDISPLMPMHQDPLLVLPLMSVWGNHWTSSCEKDDLRRLGSHLTSLLLIWPTFRTWHLARKCMDFDNSKVCYQMSNQQKVIIGSSNRLVSNRRQAIYYRGQWWSWSRKQKLRKSRECNWPSSHRIFRPRDEGLDFIWTLFLQSMFLT